MDLLSFALVGGVYLLTLMHGIQLRRGKAGHGAAVFQVIGDLLTASALVSLTGGGESPFTFAYSLAVISAAIALGRRPALVVAGAAVLAYLCILVAVDAGWLIPQLGEQPTVSLSRALFLFSSNFLAIFLIAVLVGHLSRQLSTTGGQLSQREEDLRRLGDLQRQILACMPSGLITCASDGQVTFINRAALSILALESDAPLGWHIHNLLPGVLQLGTQSSRRELTIETRTGSRILGLSVTAMERADRALLVVFQDLTELRRMEEELQRSDRLAALGAQAAQLAHEIRNPLASMRGAAQLLAQDSGIDTASSRLTSILIRESDRLAQLVEDFLHSARPPPSRKRNVVLDILLKETLDMLRTDPLARGVRIDMAAEHLDMPADPDQLRQVFVNLLRNGFQAAGPQGEVRVNLERSGDRALVRFWDSAGAIAPGDQARIFEPFFSTKEGGTGLGLSTARTIVQAHGGELRVQSNSSGGTEFVVELPIHQREREATCTS